MGFWRSVDEVVGFLYDSGLLGVALVVVCTLVY